MQGRGQGGQGVDGIDDEVWTRRSGRRRIATTTGISDKEGQQLVATSPLAEGSGPIWVMT